jgi:predicted nucleic acid-binding protein
VLGAFPDPAGCGATMALPRPYTAERRCDRSHFLWRSELRNVLTAYLRRGLLSRAQIVRILRAADHALDVVATSSLTAYDAGFGALASTLSVPLVTADKAVCKAFPQLATTMAAFVASASL